MSIVYSEQTGTATWHVDKSKPLGTGDVLFTVILERHDGPVPGIETVGESYVTREAAIVAITKHIQAGTANAAA